MGFQASINHVGLAKGFFLKPDVYQAAIPFLTRAMSLDPAARLQAVREASKALIGGKFPSLPDVPTMGNHYHTTFSWGNDGFRGFPAAAALISKLNGSIVTGLVDHYSMKGFPEFREASGCLGLPCTTGFEIRALVRDQLILNGHDLNKIIINSPGKRREAYIVFHGVITDSNNFLDRALPVKLGRYEQVVGKINEALSGISGPSLNFGVVRESSMFDNVLDKHVTATLFDVLYDFFPGNFDARVDRMIQLLGNLPKTDINTKKLEEARKIENGQEREFAVFTAVMDIMRSNIMADDKLGFIEPEPAECPSFEDLAGISQLDNSILTYPILLRSAGGSEDDYLAALLDHAFDRMDFRAVSWMPNRNNGEESEMIQRETAQRGRPAISGMDVNRYLQKWVEKASANPWLIETAFALVGHEVDCRAGGLGLALADNTRGYPNNVHYLAELGGFRK